MRKVYTFVGATGRKLKFRLRDDTGNIIDGSGYTAAVISGKLGATEKIQQASCDITDIASGWVYYTPASAEIDTAGEIRCQIKLTASGVVDYSEEITIVVSDAHDYAPA